jgi:lysophospholipase L1-like esterase
MSGLIQQIAGSAPNANILVAAIIPIKDSATGWEPIIVAYNDYVRRVVDMKIAAGLHVAFLDLHSVIDQSAGSLDYSTDAVHPGDAGYAKMAAVWRGAIRAVLP